MTGGRDDEPTGPNDTDPQDWLARQFALPEDPAETADTAETPDTAETSEGAPPTLGIPLATDMPPSSVPAAFDWGFGTPSEDSVPETVEVPPELPDASTGSATEGPVQPSVPEPVEGSVEPSVPELVEVPVQPSVPEPVEGPTDDLPPAPDAALAGAPPLSADPPRVIFPWESLPAPVSATDAQAQTGILGQEAPTGATVPIEFFPPLGATSATETPTVAIPSAVPETVEPTHPRRDGTVPIWRNPRILIWTGSTLVAVLLLVGLFFLGTRLSSSAAPVPAPTKTATATPTPTPTPTPTAAPVVTGPAAAGPHKWNELRGGECVDPFSSVWAETFTVVDCAAPHPAQMVFRGTFPDAPAAYPGAPALQAQINLLCGSPTVVNLAAAGAYANIQVSASYAADAAEWAEGQHDYFCFISRAGGEPLTGSVAAAG